MTTQVIAPRRPQGSWDYPDIMDPTLDQLDRLLQLRLAVARFGESDGASWWNTLGILGASGAHAVGRGLPRTHPFARARAAFAVADQRCREQFDPPGSVTLWNLGAAIEDAFDARWEAWVDDPKPWDAFFGRIAPPATGALDAYLSGLGCVTAAEVTSVAPLRPGPGNRWVQLASTFDGSLAQAAPLALAFGLGQPGQLVVPYARVA